MSLLDFAGGDKSKQPEYGTPKYKEQVEAIIKLACEADDEKMANMVVMMYVLDLSYSRAAISEAMKQIDKHFKGKQ